MEGEDSEPEESEETREGMEGEDSEPEESEEAREGMEGEDSEPEESQETREGMEGGDSETVAVIDSSELRVCFALEGMTIWSCVF
jgi:hypothetical protein